jgi:hypothetical protein
VRITRRSYSSQVKKRSASAGRQVYLGDNLQNGQKRAGNIFESEAIDTERAKFSEMSRNQEEHLAYRELMLKRLQSAGLTEEEFEEYIRLDKEALISNLDQGKLKALMIVINKEDFKNNFDFNEEEYLNSEKKFNLLEEKSKKISALEKPKKRRSVKAGNVQEAKIRISKNIGSKLSSETKNGNFIPQRSSPSQKAQPQPSTDLKDMIQGTTGTVTIINPTQNSQTTTHFSSGQHIQRAFQAISQSQRTNQSKFASPIANSNLKVNYPQNRICSPHQNAQTHNLAHQPQANTTTSRTRVIRSSAISANAASKASQGIKRSLIGVTKTIRPYLSPAKQVTMSTVTNSVVNNSYTKHGNLGFSQLNVANPEIPQKRTQRYIPHNQNSLNHSNLIKSELQQENRINGNHNIQSKNVSNAVVNSRIANREYGFTRRRVRVSKRVRAGKENLQVNIPSQSLTKSTKLGVKTVISPRSISRNSVRTQNGSNTSRNPRYTASRVVQTVRTQSRNSRKLNQSNMSSNVRQPGIKRRKKNSQCLTKIVIDGSRSVSPYIKVKESRLSSAIQGNKVNIIR